VCAGSFLLNAAPVAYISNTSSDDVWVVDLTCQSVVAVILVGDDPRGITASPDGSRVFVANRFDNTISVIATATRTVVQTIDLGASTNVTATEPYDVVISPDGARLYVAMKNGGSENGGGTVVFVDLPSGNIVKEVSLDSSASPEGIAISPDGNRLYVGARRGGFTSWTCPRSPISRMRRASRRASWW
jgi:YVTN family beta-propeller protein